MKRFGYIVLLSILLLQSGGLFLLYKMQQFKVHYEMFQTLQKNKTEFQKLTLTVSDFKKSKINAHEISYNGKMYDYKSAAISGNSVKLLVINDTDEENILEKIKNLIGSATKKSSELPTHLVKLLTFTYECPDTKTTFLPYRKQKNTFFPFAEKILSGYSEISSPPPKLV